MIEKKLASIGDQDAGSFPGKSADWVFTRVFR